LLDNASFVQLDDLDQEGITVVRLGFVATLSAVIVDGEPVRRFYFAGVLGYIFAVS
jgi:hypothetical protein